MKLSLVPLIGSLLLLASACTPSPSSQTKDESIPARAPFSYRTLSSGDIQKAAGTFGFPTAAAAGTYTNARCVNCHSKLATIDGMQGLFEESYRVDNCMNINSTTPDGARDLLACLTKLRGGTYDPTTGEPVVSTSPFTIDQIKAALTTIKAKDLGIYSAAIGHSEFSRIFSMAEMQETYQEWKPTVQMPYGRDALADQEAENLVLWFTSGLNELASYVQHDGPDVCRSPADSFIGSKVKEHVTRMSLDGEGWEFVNLARGVPMFACSGSDKLSCFQQKNGADDVFPAQNELLQSGVKGTVRKLHTYASQTSYWIRSSADGRFIAHGGMSAIVDLQPKLSGSAIRSVSVEADFDPSFTPDNQAFLYQGSAHGTRICSQSLLNQADLATVDFMNAGCSTSDLQVGLYQGLGSNLDNGDIVTINGGFQSDGGSELFQSVAPLFPESSDITVTTIRRADATAFEKVSTFKVPTPYQASWMASPSNLLYSAVVSASTAKKARHGGYRLVLSSAVKEGSELPAFDDASTAMLCTGNGEKPNISFDERLLAYYAYGQHGAQVSPAESSADIFIIDLLGSGAPVQVTQMPKGMYAQFPHFRSDGWLYFSVYDSTTGKRHVMATDAGILLTQ